MRVVKVVVALALVLIFTGYFSADAKRVLRGVGAAAPGGVKAASGVASLLAKLGGAAKSFLTSDAVKQGMSTVASTAAAGVKQAAALTKVILAFATDPQLLAAVMASATDPDVQADFQRAKPLIDAISKAATSAIPGASKSTQASKTPQSSKPAQSAGDAVKAPDAKPQDAKPSDAKPSDAKPSDAKPVDDKSSPSTKSSPSIVPSAVMPVVKQLNANTIGGMHCVLISVTNHMKANPNPDQQSKIAKLDGVLSILDTLRGVMAVSNDAWKCSAEKKAAAGSPDGTSSTTSGSVSGATPDSDSATAPVSGATPDPNATPVSGAAPVPAGGA